MLTCSVGNSLLVSVHAKNCCFDLFPKHSISNKTTDWLYHGDRCLKLNT